MPMKILILSKSQLDKDLMNKIELEVMNSLKKTRVDLQGKLDLLTK
jgi:hypothetical protein